MKRRNTFKIAALTLAMMASTITYAQVGVGTTDPKASLDISSTSSGVLIPRMDTTTRTGLTVAADQNGMMVYDTTTASFWYYDHPNTAWVEVSGGSTKFVDGTTTAADAVFTGGNVGIGTTDPANNFDLVTSNGRMHSSGRILELQRWSGSDTTGPVMIFFGQQGGNGSPTSVVDGFQVGRIFSFAHDGTNNINVSRIRSLVKGTVSTGVIPTAIDFTNMDTSGAFNTNMIINPDGNIGMGTTDPKASLDISSTTSGVLIPRMDTTTRTGLTVAADQNGMMVYDTDTASFWYYDHSNTTWVEVGGGSGKFVDGTTATDAVFTGGNVGIGTTEPGATLDVQTNNGKFTINSAFLAQLSRYNSASSGPSIILNAQKGSQETPTAVDDGYQVARFFGYAHDGTSNINVSRIRSLVKGTVSTGAIPTAIDFTNMDASGAFNTNMIIDPDGNVGIGTTDPDAKLDVQTNNGKFTINSAFLAQLSRYNSASSGPSIILNAQKGSQETPTAVDDGYQVARFFGYAHDGTSNINVSRIRSLVKGTVSTGAIPTAIDFTNMDASGAFNTNMIINPDGNVGIGTTDPGVKLEVSGYIKVGSSDTSGDATPAAGMIRFHSGTNKFQGYNGSTWVDLH